MIAGRGAGDTRTVKLGPGKHFGQSLRERACAGLTLKLLTYPPGQRQPLHVHAHPTLFLLVSGQHRDQSRQGDHDQEALTFIFHPTTAPHAGAVGPEGMLAFNLEFTPRWLERHELQARDLGSRLAPSVSLRSRLRALRLLRMAFQEGAEADLETQALEVLEPFAAGRAAANLLPVPRWLRRGEDFLRASFRDAISLRDAAREAGVHPVYFARVFRQHHGCPVSAYLRALRLIEAGGLILRQGNSLAATACAVGFSDQAHLSRCFRRELGFSPRELRDVTDRLG